MRARHTAGIVAWWRQAGVMIWKNQYSKRRYVQLSDKDNDEDNHVDNK